MPPGVGGLGTAAQSSAAQLPHVYFRKKPIELPAYTQSDEADNFSELLSRRAHHNLESQAHPTSRVYSSTPEWGNAVLTKEPMKSVNKALYQRAVRSTPMSSLRGNESSPPWLTFATQQNSTQITDLKKLIKDGLCNDANFKGFNLINIRPEDIKFDYITPENGFSLPNVAVKNEPENPRLYGVFSVGAGTQKRQFKFLLSWDNLPARENGHHEEAFGRTHHDNNGNAAAGANGVSQRGVIGQRGWETFNHSANEQAGWGPAQTHRTNGFVEEDSDEESLRNQLEQRGLSPNDLNGSRRLPLEDQSLENEASFNDWNGLHSQTEAAGRTDNGIVEEEFPQDPDLIQQNPSPSQNGRPTFDEQSTTRSSLLGGSRTPVGRAQTSRTPLVDGLGPGFGFGGNSNHLSPGLFSDSALGSRSVRGSFNPRSWQTPAPSPGAQGSQQTDADSETESLKLKLTVQEILDPSPALLQLQPGLTSQPESDQSQEQNSDEDTVPPPVFQESQRALPEQSQSARPYGPLELQKREKAPPSTLAPVHQTPSEPQREIELDTTGPLASNFFARR